MTDRIITRFFGLCPPAFQTVSATLHLPLGGTHNATPDDEQRLRALLRDLDHNSDRHLTEGVQPKVDALIAEKRRLIAEEHGKYNSPWTRSRRRENYARCRRLQELNRDLASFSVDQRNAAEAELNDVTQQLAANQILSDREYSFCLFPEDLLRAFLTDGLVASDP